MNRPGTHPRQQDSLITSEENRAMFNHIAGYYDGTNRILSLGLDGWWRRTAVRALAPVSGRTYLDVGCGTGDVTLETIRQAPQSKVTGIDPSPGMLEIGRAKIGNAGLSDAVSLVSGDVLRMEFPDGFFDGAITSFCIRNVTDRKRALAEIFRVLRPGAKFVILELTEPAGPIMKPLFSIYAKVVMPMVTKVLSSVSAYRYLSDSMADFPKSDIFSDLMQKAGFVDVRNRRLTGGIVTLFEGWVPTSQP